MSDQATSHYESSKLNCLSNNEIILECDDKLIELQLLEVSKLITDKIIGFDLLITQSNGKESLVQIPGSLLYKLANKYTTNSNRYYFLKDLLMTTHNSLLRTQNIYDIGLPLHKNVKLSFRLRADDVFNYNILVAKEKYDISLLPSKQYVHKYVKVGDPCLQIESNNGIYIIKYTPTTSVTCKGLFIESEAVHQVSVTLKSNLDNVVSSTQLDPKLTLLDTEHRWTSIHSNELYQATAANYPRDIINELNNTCHIYIPPIHMNWLSIKGSIYTDMYHSFLTLDPGTNIEFSIKTSKICNVYVLLNELLEFEN